MNAVDYDPLCGTHIRVASETARKMAIANNCSVRFKFNDVYLVATRKTSVTSLLWTFDLVMNQHSQTYRKSKRYAEQERRRKQKLADDQQTVNHILNTLDASIANGLSDVVLWLSRFSEVADDCGLVYSEHEMAQKLTAAGYVNGQHCGRPQSDFDNRQVLGEWIVGQAISALEHGLPPHPITQKFAEQYFNIRSE